MSMGAICGKGGMSVDLSGSLVAFRLDDQRYGRGELQGRHHQAGSESRQNGNENNIPKECHCTDQWQGKPMECR
jgi:hypothetical protein